MLVLGMRWGDTVNFPKCCVNLCVVILHQGVQVWALLVGGLNMFKMGGNKSKILHLTSCLGTPPYLGLCVASCQFSLSQFEDFFKMF